MCKSNIEHQAMNLRRRVLFCINCFKLGGGDGNEGLEILLSVPERAMQLCDFLVLMLPKMLLF